MLVICTQRDVHENDELVSKKTYFGWKTSMDKENTQIRFQQQLKHAL